MKENRKKAKLWNPFALDNDKFFPSEAVSGVPRRLAVGCASLVREQYKHARENYERLRDEDPILRMRKIEQQKREEAMRESEESVVKAIDNLCEKVADPSYYPRAFRHLETLERIKRKRKQEKQFESEPTGLFMSMRRHANLDPLSWMQCKISELEEKIGKQKSNETFSEKSFIGDNAAPFRKASSITSGGGIGGECLSFEDLFITKSGPVNKENSTPLWHPKTRAGNKNCTNKSGISLEPSLYGVSSGIMWANHNAVSNATRTLAERYDRIATLQSGWLNGVDQQTLLDLAKRNAMREEERALNPCPCDENAPELKEQLAGEIYGDMAVCTPIIGRDSLANDTVLENSLKKLQEMQESLISDSEYRMQKSDIRRVPRKTGPLRSRGRFMCKILKRQNNNVTFDFTELMKEE